MSKKKLNTEARGSDTRKLKVPFTQIANSVLNDKTLSLRAKGLFAYIYSKPDGWHFSTWRMSKESIEGRDAIRTAELELIKAGYLTRKKLVSGRIQLDLTFKKVMPKKDDEVCNA